MLTTKKSGCVICGAELIFTDSLVSKKCEICGSEDTTNVYCENEHFICDKCHSSSGKDYIELSCLNTDVDDPVRLAELLMQHDSIKMHGPEHHFLVPAVLLTSYSRANGEKELLHERLFHARKRADKVPGGACGFHGNCGAAVGAGIFMSIITGAKPVSDEGFKAANKLTGICLLEVAENGGPRCCKRDTFIAIIEAVKYLKLHMNIELKSEMPVCNFYDLNKECKKNNCMFFPK